MRAVRRFGAMTVEAGRRDGGNVVLGLVRNVAIAAVCLLTAIGPYRLAAQSIPNRAPQGPGVYAITNATIVPVTGPRIERGTVVIRGGRIEAVGASVQPPSDAQRIDGTGLFVYPGLIDAGTTLGLIEVGQGGTGTVDVQELGDFNPHNIALTAVNAHSELIPTVRVGGVTTVITAPRGGQISGQASLIDLWGWTPQEMAVRPRAAMVMTYPRLGGGGGFGGFGGQQQNPQQQRERVQQQTRALREYLEAARAYMQARERARGTPNEPAMNLQFESLVPALRGEMPVIFDVETADQIRGVLALADSFGLRVVLQGASYAWQLADTLAARRIPVIVGPTTASPAASDPYDMIYANPGVLARAGVQIAFRTNSASDSRNLPYNAALATAYGLDPEEAIRALTINAARIFGVDDRLGSIEPGKIANLIVTTGDPLDVRTTTRHVFVRGELTPADDRHTRLYERARSRPRQRT